jgi:hypothetical protein
MGIDEIREPTVNNNGVQKRVNFVGLKTDSEPQVNNMW